MKQTLYINLMITVLVLVALVLTQQPLVLLCLLMLHELPYGLEQTKMHLDAGGRPGDDADGNSRPIGFTADVD